jgi:glutamyl/glutaminyl-tRNA synthetase
VWDGSQPLRFKSEPKAYKWHDAVMGDLSAGAEAVDDFILIKSDGFPTYNFAHIVDDAEMKISHIIRGQEFVASMPNYLNLYEALELTPPIFATVPHILNETGNKKLGKRDGAKDVLEYLRDGFLPEALVNFIASLGWNDGTEQEIFSLDELIAKFSLERVQKSGARFDERRLLWMNGQWIKKLSLEDLYRRTNPSAHPKSPEQASKKPSTEPLQSTRPQLHSKGLRLRQIAVGEAEALAKPSVLSGEVVGSKRLDNGCVSEGADSGDFGATFWGENGQKATAEEQKQVLSVVQDRLKTLADLPALSEYFFARPKPDWVMVDANKPLSKLTRGQQIELLKTAESQLAEISPTDWQTEILQSKLNEILSLTGQKPPVLFGIIRFALTWAPFSPGLPETMALLGRDETLARLQIS